MGGWRWGVLVVALLACSARDPLEGANFTSVALGRSNPQAIYTATGSGEIYRTTDGGETWESLTTPWTIHDPSRVTRIAVSPADANVVLIGTASGEVYRSTNGGSSWRSVGADVFSDNVTRLAFHPTRAERAYAIDLGGLLISTDAGLSWTKQGTLTAASPACRLNDYCSDFAFDAQDGDRMYAACSGGVVVSINAGACWGASNDSPQHTSVVVASPSEPLRVWAAASDGVWASQDGAASFVRLTDWTTVFAWPDVPARTPPQTMLTTITTAAYVDGASGPALLFGTSDIGVLSVLTDTGAVSDVGASLVRRAGAIDDIMASSSGVFLAAESTCRGRAGVFFSSDQGGTWNDVVTSHPFPDLTDPIGDPVPHELMVIFYRDVSLARQQQIMQEHHVTPQYPGLSGPLLYFVTTAQDDPRSVADLLQEFEALDEIDCALNDFYMTYR